MIIVLEPSYLTSFITFVQKDTILIASVFFPPRMDLSKHWAVKQSKARALEVISDPDNGRRAREVATDLA